MRLVVRAPDVRRARALQEALARAEVDAVALSGAAATQPAAQGEDLTLIDADAADQAVFVKALRRPAAGSLAFVGLTTRTPTRLSGFDAWAPVNGAPLHLQRTLDVAFRDGVAREEARARRRTAADLGAPAPGRAASVKPLSALFIGAPHLAFLAVEHAWLRLGGAVAATFTSFSAFDQLQDERFDAVALNAVSDAGAALALAGAMRRNARLNRTPILTIISASQASEKAEFERAGCLIAPDDANFTGALTWLAEAVDRVRAHAADLRILQAVPEGQSPWSPKVFAAHLDTQAGVHHAGGRALTLGALRFPAASVRDEASRRGLAELGGLSVRLIRASDAIATRDDGFLLAFPCTDRHGAETALARVSAVWAHTAFIANGPPEARAYRRFAFELAPGESGASLLSRAERAMAS